MGAFALQRPWDFDAAGEDLLAPFGLGILAGGEVGMVDVVGWLQIDDKVQMVVVVLLRPVVVEVAVVEVAVMVGGAVVDVRVVVDWAVVVSEVIDDGLMVPAVVVMV